MLHFLGDLNKPWQGLLLSTIGQVYFVFSKPFIKNRQSITCEFQIVVATL